MIKILHKFFNFCGKNNKRKFQISIFLGAIQALCEAMKILAIMIILIAIMNNSLNTGVIFTTLGIMIGSMIIDFITRMRSNMLQTEAGYGAATFKRIEIAQHLRYLPMGYFNKNSLGSITSVTTNTMENLGDIATRVVMLSTQGILNTALILAMLIVFDYRIGLISTAGVIVFLIVNRTQEKSFQKIRLIQTILS